MKREESCRTTPNLVVNLSYSATATSLQYSPRTQAPPCFSTGEEPGYKEHYAQITTAPCHVFCMHGSQLQDGDS